MTEGTRWSAPNPDIQQIPKLSDLDLPADGNLSVDLDVSCYFISMAFSATCKFPKGTTAFEIWCNAHPDSFVARNHRMFNRFESLFRELERGEAVDG